MKHNKSLPVINGDDVVSGTTCFSVHSKHNVNCERKSCKHWIEHSEGNNCVIISAQNGPYTLQKIGKIYNLSRMRICQIEKDIYEKIRNLT